MLILATTLLVSLLGVSTQEIQMNCPLARDIEEAALTRNIHLGGEFEKTDSPVEKVTLAAEIYALDQLREQMFRWLGANCRPDNNQPQ